MIRSLEANVTHILISCSSFSRLSSSAAQLEIKFPGDCYQNDAFCHTDTPSETTIENFKTLSIAWIVLQSQACKPAQANPPQVTTLAVQILVDNGLARLCTLQINIMMHVYDMDLSSSSYGCCSLFLHIRLTCSTLGVWVSAQANFALYPSVCAGAGHCNTNTAHIQLSAQLSTFITRMGPTLSNAIRLRIAMPSLTT